MSFAFAFQISLYFHLLEDKKLLLKKVVGRGILYVRVESLSETSAFSIGIHSGFGIPLSFAFTNKKTCYNFHMSEDKKYLLEKAGRSLELIRSEFFPDSLGIPVSVAFNNKKDRFFSFVRRLKNVC